MNRLISYGFIICLIYLSILEGDADDHVLLIRGLIYSIIVAYAAFFLAWVTLDATQAIIVLGTIILGFGGWMLAVAVVLFFFTGSLLTHRNFDREPLEERMPQHDKRRDGMQVWANGFWIGLFCILWFYFDLEPFLIAAFACVATATADTWATEIGINQPGKTWNIRTFEPVEPGTNGGVSTKGTLASLLGAFTIGMLAIWAEPASTAKIVVIVTISGILGCVIDSFIGATYQANDNTEELPLWNSLADIQKNSLVNWISVGSSGLVAFLLYIII